MDMTGKEAAFPMRDSSRVNELLSGIKVNNSLLEVTEPKDFYREDCYFFLAECANYKN
jgi:hypothetical protein